MGVIADRIKAGLLLKGKRIQEEALNLMAKKAETDMTTVVAGMPRETRPKVVIEVIDESTRKVYWDDPIRITFKSGGSASRMELLEKGTRPYSKPRDGRPMRFRVGGQRSTVPKQIKQGNPTPSTDWVSTYSRKGMESGDWIPLVAERTSESAPEAVREAALAVN